MFSLLHLVFKVKHGEELVWGCWKEVLPGLKYLLSARESCFPGVPLLLIGPAIKAACVKPESGGGASSFRPFCDLSGSQVIRAWQPYRNSWHRTPSSFPSRWREETPHSPSQGQEAGVSHGIPQLGQIITGHLCLFVYKHAIIQPL